MDLFTLRRSSGDGGQWRTPLGDDTKPLLLMRDKGNLQRAAFPLPHSSLPATWDFPMSLSLPQFLCFCGYFHCPPWRAQGNSGLVLLQ
uniref:Uncharacterized protein n=1 Tax=Gallus gallus TaxID=9031 RepID=A0A8V0Z2W0_CHICK